MKKWIETIQELRKNPKGKAMLFFGFYLLFFLSIIAFVRYSSRNHMNASDYEKGSTTVEEVYALLDLSYSYKVHFTVDDTFSYDLVGKTNHKEEEFSYLNQNYYCNQKSCFIKEEEKWITTEYPNAFRDFLKPENIVWIFENAKLESKTSYESGKMVYNYFITTDSLNERLFDVSTDLDLEANMVTLQTDEDHQLSSITYQLDSYGKYYEKCKNHLKIEIEYFNLGEDISIQNPITDE